MMDRTGRWRRFRLLPKEQRRALLAAFAALPIIWLALRGMSFRRVQVCFARTFPSSRPAPVPSVEGTLRAREFARMVAASAREGIIPGKCLEQSLALWWLLGRRGVSTQLRIGVRMEQGQLHAHAWVELDGEVLNDAESLFAGYAPFARDFGNLQAGRP
jgi:hypothetical protein